MTADQAKELKQIEAWINKEAHDSALGYTTKVPIAAVSWLLGEYKSQQRQYQELDAAAGAMREALEEVQKYGQLEAREEGYVARALQSTAGKAPLERLEKMRNCGNCKYSPDGDNGCNCIPGDCIERDYEHWVWEGEVSGEL
jgi:hypothetical protein